MKPKIKLSGADIKKFFVTHGEKLVLAVTVVILILFVMGVFNSQPISGDKPNQISQQATAKRTEITSPSNLPQDDGVPTPDFAAMAQKASQEIPLAAIKWPKVPDPALFPELMKRSDPDILPPVELLAVANAALVPYKPTDPTAPGAAPGASPTPAARSFSGRGRSRFADEDEEDFSARRPPPRSAFGATNPGGALGQPETMERAMGSRARDAEPQPKFIVTVTGIVDVDKQIEEYQRRFEYAEKPSAQLHPDVPRYYFTMIQRAEVPSPDTPVDQLKWENIDVKSALIDSANWATTVPEVANPAFLFGKELIPALNQSISVTWDLPPMYLKGWGPEATHPKLPTVQPADVPMDVGPDPTAPDPFNLTNPGAAGPGGAQGVAPGGALAPGARPGFGQPFRGGRFAGEEDEGRFGRGGYSAAPSGLPLPKGLFRYVDLTALPGRTYRYRAQIWMHNPNLGVHPQYVEKPESSTKPYLTSAWSEPSVPVKVPEKYQVLAEAINVPRTAINEPTAKINVITFYKDPGAPTAPAAGALGAGGGLPGAANPLGAGALDDPLTAVAPPRPVWLHLMKDFSLAMGEVASWKNVTMDNAVDMTMEAARKIEKIAFETNDSMLLDLRNDTPLAGPRSEGPAELLMMDASGRLYCVDSLSDMVVVKDYQAQTAEFQPLPMEEPAPVGRNRREIDDEEILPGGRRPPTKGGRRGRGDR